jgi:hypothetical protein
MNKANIEPKHVLRERLAQLIKEREEIKIDLERDEEEYLERYGDFIEPTQAAVDEAIREDQNFWRTEIYKYDFCIEEVERIMKMIG